MNVQYIKEYTDQHGKTFQCGWTAEHDDPEAQRRIDMGVCKKVPKGTFSRKNETMEPPTECVAMPSNDASLLQSTQSTPKAQYAQKLKTKK